jgi:hypothetical protein
MRLLPGVEREERPSYTPEEAKGSNSRLAKWLPVADE